MEWTRGPAKNLNWPDLRLTSSGSCMIARPGEYNIVSFVFKYAEYALCFVVLCIFSLPEKHEFLAVKSTIQEFLEILNLLPKSAQTNKMASLNGLCTFIGNKINFIAYKCITCSLITSS